MNSTRQLRAFYEKHLLPDLRVLEKQRRRVVGDLILTGSIGGVLFLGLLFFFPVAGNSTDDAEFVLLIGLGGLAITGYICRRICKGYRISFKKDVIRKLVKFINPKLKYTPDAGIDRRVFEKSDIFKEEINRFEAEDHVHGRIGSTEIGFSEVSAQYVTHNVGSSNKTTIFHGLYFVADFNKHFQGKTVVLPDLAECEFGWFGRKLQSWNRKRDPLVQLEDPEFEREFVVYGSDQIEARYILSTRLMERILKFKQKTGKCVSLAFVDSNVFVAIPLGRNLFEPHLFKSILNFQSIVDYIDHLQLAIGIVEDLDLNTRIWSKA